ncbi:hypothetical protein LR48_Vigan01g271900 [Vigna angularis]|uniref:Uncharacterized protein n=1 Tax=Phaseolus angularis TaxID=3914 RepID=A0A0L9TRF2_PHAAN|nr:hypothetical protein LR48_Vigan01g271900 [Vigna angularis]
MRKQQTPWQPLTPPKHLCKIVSLVVQIQHAFEVERTPKSSSSINLRRATRRRCHWSTLSLSPLPPSSRLKPCELKTRTATATPGETSSRCRQSAPISKPELRIRIVKQSTRKPTIIVKAEG